MVNSYSTNQNFSYQYGNMQRVGTTSDNRTIYNVIAPNGKVSSRISIPTENVDKFEKSYKDMIQTMPDMQKYAKEMSDPSKVKKKKIMSNTALLTGGLLGIGIPAYLTRSKSTLKKVLSISLGALVGIGLGVITSLSIIMPPDVAKFLKATKTMSNVDIQQFDKMG